MGMNVNEATAEAGLKLLDLACDWTVAVACEGANWHVRLTSRDDARSHHYYGPDVARVIRAAHAGEPAGRVS
jgi:hypothetical protein